MAVVVTPSAALLQRFRTDVAVQQYLRERTKIPLPAFVSTLEEDGAMYLVIWFVEGVGMNELPEKDRKVVQKELQQHIETLKSLRSDITRRKPSSEVALGRTRHAWSPPRERLNYCSLLMQVVVVR